MTKEEKIDALKDALIEYLSEQQGRILQAMSDAQLAWSIQFVAVNKMMEGE